MAGRQKWPPRRKSEMQTEQEQAFLQNLSILHTEMHNLTSTLRHVSHSYHDLVSDNMGAAAPQLPAPQLLSRAISGRERVAAIRDQVEALLRMVYCEEVDVETGSLYSLDEFAEMCERGHLIDYDGHGAYVYNGYIISERNVQPSTYFMYAPEKDWATHIIWFNR